MRYRETVPADDLRDHILSFWEFAVPADAPELVDFEIFPDGCVSLFHFRNRRDGIDTIGLTGLNLSTVAKRVSPGDEIRGVRFSPAALAGMLGRDPKYLVDGNGSGCEDLPGILGDVFEQVSQAGEFVEAVNVFESYFRNIIATGAGRVDLKIASAVSLIEAARADINVENLANSVGLSTRQLQRRFKVSSGLSPKQFIRCRRMRYAAVHLVEQTLRNWAERAADIGFADQSHLTHEFAAITNRSPVDFARGIARVDHGEIIK
ncbi:MAG: AraC family transcriptional regulator [Acidobacteriota bacterium]